MMRILSRAMLFGVGLTALPAVAAEFDLEIGGSVGAPVVGACLVAAGKTVEVVVIDGVIPQSRRFDAAKMSCLLQLVEPGGRLVVEVAKNGRVTSRNVTSGGNSVTTISVQ